MRRLRLHGHDLRPLRQLPAELFPAKVRYSGAGLSYNLAAITGGAFAPTIASALVMNFGIQSLGWYLGGMALVALVALAFFRESKDVDFEQ